MLLTFSSQSIQIDSFLQTYSPTYHLIIEPHPDVLAYAKTKGFYSKPGVHFYEGTWQQYLKDLEDEKEEYKCFDVVYFGEKIFFFRITLYFY